MEPCTVKNRKTPVVLAITVIAIVLLVCLYRKITGLMIFLAICGVVVTLGFLVMTYTVILTQEGISCKNLFRPMTAAWSDIASISVVYVSKGRYICIARKDRFDVLIPYSEELKAAILAYRGFLDRDDMAKFQ